MLSFGFRGGVGLASSDVCGIDMAVLMERALVRASPGVVASAASVSSFRKPVSVRTAAPKPLRLAACRASSENGSAEKEASQERMIFKDEQNEIICYYDSNGDVVCEGWDEGPHFKPDPQQPTLRRRRKITRVVQARGSGEVVDFKNIKERMREAMRDETKESFGSSEL